MPTVSMPTPNVQRVAEKASEAMSEITQQAMMATNSRNKCDAVYVAAIGIMSAVHVLASLLGRCPDDEDKKDPANYVNRASILAAALLAARIGEDSSGDTVRAEFGPQIMLEAIANAEKILGESADKYLDPVMLSGTREIVSNGSSNELMEALKSGKVSMLRSERLH